MKSRLINCDFLNESSFKVKLSNKSKLLYFYMFLNADDKGFVGTTLEIIKTLNENDEVFENHETLNLIQHTYMDALYDLIQRGLLIEFIDNHDNKVHLIVHWFYHNHLYDRAWSNYSQFLKRVKLVNNKYVLKTRYAKMMENQEIETPPKDEEEVPDWDKMIEDLEPSDQ